MKTQILKHDGLLSGKTVEINISEKFPVDLSFSSIKIFGFEITAAVYN